MAAGPPLPPRPAGGAPGRGGPGGGTGGAPGGGDGSPATAGASRVAGRREHPVSYVIAGYGITAVVLAAYSARILRRGRAISRTLPPSPAAGGRPGGRDDATGRGWK